MRVRDLVFTQSAPQARVQSQQLRRPGDIESRTFTVVRREDSDWDSQLAGTYYLRALRKGVYAGRHGPISLDVLELQAMIADMVVVDDPPPYRNNGPRGAKRARHALNEETAT